MGVGKTTIGHRLANSLNLKFRDLDDIIVNEQQMPISKIFDKKGELYFRKIETQYLIREIETQNPMVLSLGGGTPCYAHNMQFLQKQPHVVTIYLKAQITTLVERLFKQRQIRPMIGHLNTEAELSEFIGKHLFERRPFYLKSQHTISVDDKSEEAVVRDILNAIKVN